ncbi:MAG TPA: TIGR04372 family glycosyltransferase [Plantibacter sp.]|uniref:TIGR04372 family glycosyltransferase n=1 Tax=Plantibacter sp. TaxID=1871045 RepID=UPI002B524A38|nr:TIGR04372 family glycosyltransferase [Plantibacter sp.]
MRELGLDTERPFVVLHTRAYPNAAEVETRNFLRGTRPESYVACVRRLRELGYQTIHVGGEAASSPLPVSVTVAPDDPDAVLLQLWSVANAHFFIATDSGPYQLSWLLRTPCLHTNLLNVIGLYPLRPFDRCLPKRLVDRDTGVKPGFAQLMADDDWLGNRKNRLRQFDYVDNTPEELMEAAEDMVADLRDASPPTTAQVWYRERVVSVLGSDHARGKIQAKIGAPEVFVGHGRISRRFAEGDAPRDWLSARPAREEPLPAGGLTDDPGRRDAEREAANRVQTARQELQAVTKRRFKLEAALRTLGAEALTTTVDVVDTARSPVAPVIVEELMRIEAPRRPPRASWMLYRARSAAGADAPDEFAAEVGSAVEVSVPRVVHHVWLGTVGEPSEAMQVRKSWQERHPRWEHRIWVESNLPHGLRRTEIYERLRSSGERTQLLRLELLRLFGGVCLDRHLALTGPLEPALGDAEFVAASAPTGAPDAAILAAVREHLLIEQLLDAYPVVEFAGEPYADIGSLLSSALLATHAGARLLEPQRIAATSTLVSPATVAVQAPSILAHAVERLLKELADEIEVVRSQNHTLKAHAAELQGQKSRGGKQRQS